MNTNLFNEVYKKKNWRHKIRIGDSVFTPGYCEEWEWELSLLPDSLNDKSFLDVASNDGMYSFLAEKKGAREVLGVDIYHEQEDFNLTSGWDISKPLLIKKILKSNAEFESRSIYNLSSMGKKYDYVYSSNVISWLKDPYSALENLADVTNEVLHLREDLAENSEIPMLKLVNGPDSECIYNPNLKYIKTILDRKGFKIFKVSVFNERQVYKKKYESTANLILKDGFKTYKDPFSNQLIEPDNFTAGKLVLSNNYVNGFYYILNTGWISKDDVESIAFKRTGFRYDIKSFLNRFGGNWLKLEKNYNIIAYKC